MQLIQSYGDKNIVLNIETKSYPDPASAGYKNNADPKKFVEVFNNIVKNMIWKIELFSNLSTGKL